MFVPQRVNVKLPNNETVYVIYLDISQKKLQTFASVSFEFVRGELDDTSSMFRVVFNGISLF